MTGTPSRGSTRSSGRCSPCLGVYLWWRLLRPVDAAARADGDQAAAGATPDPELLAWQAYLARLHEADPPGGPPARR